MQGAGTGEGKTDRARQAGSVQWTNSVVQTESGGQTAEKAEPGEWADSGMTLADLDMEQSGFG